MIFALELNGGMRAVERSTRDCPQATDRSFRARDVVTERANVACLQMDVFLLTTALTARSQSSSDSSSPHYLAESRQLWLAHPMVEEKGRTILTTSIAPGLRFSGGLDPTAPY